MHSGRLVPRDLRQCLSIDCVSPYFLPVGCRPTGTFRYGAGVRTVPLLPFQLFADHGSYGFFRGVTFDWVDGGVPFTWSLYVIINHTTPGVSIASGINDGVGYASGHTDTAGSPYTWGTTQFSLPGWSLFGGLFGASPDNTVYCISKPY